MWWLLWEREDVSTETPAELEVFRRSRIGGGMEDVPVLAAGHADAQSLVPLQSSSEVLAQQPPMILNVLGGVS